MKSLFVGGIVKVDVEELEGVGVLGGGDDSEPLSHEVLLPMSVDETVSKGSRESAEGKTNKNFLVRYLRYRFEKGMVEVTESFPGPAAPNRMSRGSLRTRKYG